MEINWDNISKKVSSAAQYTVKKTEELTSIAKLEYKIAGIKNKINLRYQRLGKIKFTEMTGESVKESVYEKEYQNICALIVSLEELEEELSLLRKYRYCIGCNAKIGYGVIYCPKCGTRQDAMDEDEAKAATSEDEI